MLENGGVCKGIAHMKLLGTIDVINVYHHQLVTGGPLSPEEVLEDVAEFYDVLYGHIDQVLVDSLTFEDISAYIIDPATACGLTTWPTLTAGGIDSSDVVATGVCALVGFGTAALRGQGRKYLAGMVESQVVDGLITDGTFISAVVLYIAQALSDWNSGNGGTYLNGIYREKTLTFYPYLEGWLNAIPGYQRRRKQGVGS